MTEAQKALLEELGQAERKLSELNFLIADLHRRLQAAASEETSAPATQDAPLKLIEIVNPGDFFDMNPEEASREFLRRLRRPAWLHEIDAALVLGKARHTPGRGAEELLQILRALPDFAAREDGRWTLMEDPPSARAAKPPEPEGEEDR